MGYWRLTTALTSVSFTERSCTMGLLILEREVGEWVHVGPDINVLLHDVRGKKAWLGFDAPRDIEIVRDDAAVLERRHRFIMSEEQCLKLKAVLLGTSPAYDINSSDDLYAALAGVASDYPQ